MDVGLPAATSLAEAPRLKARGAAGAGRTSLRRAQSPTSIAETSRKGTPRRNPTARRSSISHPARFILIGSGNPEEGELRPQLLDRFGMHAQVGTVRDAELRVKIVEERARFDRDPKTFRESYSEEQEKLQQQISSARSNLGAVQIDHDLRVKISKVCSELNVDGLRGDIVTNRAAKALAALKGRDSVTVEDIATVIPNCLRHRLRKDPLESIDSGLLVIEKFYEVFS